MELAVLGDPVTQSKSPTIHSAALAAAGIRGRYRAITVNHQGMDRLALWVRSGRLAGANITMPHKKRAFQLADVASSVAARTGSVNTWVHRGGSIEGHSTDGAGVRYAWRRNHLPETGPVVILGAGGVAAAALVALEERELWVSARSEAKAVAVTAAVGVEASFLDWGSGLAGAVVVNATPIGMNGEVLNDSVLAESAGYLEMVYGDQPTPSEQRVRDLGVPVAAGVDMLIGQAMASFELWTGMRAVESAMWESLSG